MNFKDYQKQTTETAIYPNQGSIMGLAYVGLGLGEVGEIQGKLKKILRDDSEQVTEEKKTEIAKEVGDALWYLSQLCNELGIDLGECAQNNLDKLASRASRGVLKGSGDNR